MSNTTLAAAREREKACGAIFLGDEEPIESGKNVFVLIRLSTLPHGPFFPTYATLLKETVRGNVSVFLYCAGKVRRTVSRLAVLTRPESDWCQGKDIYSTCIHHDFLKASVYRKRREYIRQYPRNPERARQELDELTIEEIARDWSAHPECFTLAPEK